MNKDMRALLRELGVTEEKFAAAKEVVAESSLEETTSTLLFYETFHFAFAELSKALDQLLGLLNDMKSSKGDDGRVQLDVSWEAYELLAHLHVERTAAHMIAGKGDYGIAN